MYLEGQRIKPYSSPQMENKCISNKQYIVVLIKLKFITPFPNSFNASMIIVKIAIFKTNAIILVKFKSSEHENNFVEGLKTYILG